MYNLRAWDGRIYGVDAAQLAELAMHPDDYGNLCAPLIEFAKICQLEGFPGITLKFIASIIIHQETIKMSLLCADDDAANHIFYNEQDFEALEYFYNYLARKDLEESIRESYIRTLCYNIVIAIIDEYDISDKYAAFATECTHDLSDQTWIIVSQVGEIDLTGLILFLNLNYRLMLRQKVSKKVVPDSDIAYIKELYEVKTSASEILAQQQAIKLQAEQEPNKKPAQPEDSEWVEQRNRVINNIIDGLCQPPQSINNGWFDEYFGGGYLW